MAANETLTVQIKVDVVGQAQLDRFRQSAIDTFRRVTVEARAMNAAIAASKAPFNAMGQAASQANQQVRQVAQHARGAAIAYAGLGAAARNAAAGVRAVAPATAAASRAAGGLRNSFKDIFQHALLGFQIFQVGLKNFGQQGFNQIFRSVQDLSRNIFRSFRGISSEGTSIFGKLVSFIGSSLEGIVTVAGNVASNVIKSLAAIPKAITGIIGGALQSVGSLGVIFLKGLPQVAGLIASQIGGVFKTLGDVVGGALSSIGQIAENISRIVAGALRGLTTIARTVVDGIVGAFEGLVGAIGRIFGTIADIAGKALGGLGLVAAGAAGFILRDFGTLEQGIARVLGAIGDSSEETRKRLTDFAQSLRREFGVGAKEATDALFLAFTSGARDAAESLDLAREAFRLTAVNGGDVSQVVETLARTFQTFRGEVSSVTEVADLLQITVKEGLANFQQLSTELGSLTGTASAAGASLKETLAALTGLTQRLSVSEATTSLARLLDSLAAAEPEAQKVRDELGLVFREFTPEVGKAVGELTRLRDAQEDAFRQAEESGKASRIELKRLREEIDKSDAAIERLGQSEASFVGIEESIRRIVNVLKNFREPLPILNELFPDIRARRAVVQLATEQGLVSLEQAKKLFGEAAGTLDIAVKPTLETLKKTFESTIEAAFIFGDALARAVGPAAIAGLKELGSLFDRARSQFEAFAQSAEGREFFANLADGVRSFVRDGIPAMIRGIKEFGSAAIETFQTIRSFASPIFDLLADKGRKVLDAFKQGPTFEEVFRGLGDGDFSALTEKLSAAFEAIRLDPLFARIEKGFRDSVATLVEAFADAVDFLKVGLASAVVFFQTAFGNAIRLVAPALRIAIGIAKPGSLAGIAVAESFAASVDTSGLSDEEAFQAKKRARLEFASAHREVTEFLDKISIAGSDFARSAEETGAEIIASSTTIAQAAREFAGGLRDTGDRVVESSVRAEKFIAALDVLATVITGSATAVDSAAEAAKRWGEAARASGINFLEQAKSFLSTLGANVGRFITTGQFGARAQTTPAGFSSLAGGGGIDPGLEADLKREQERGNDLLGRLNEITERTSDSEISAILDAREAFIDGFQESTDILRGKLDRLIDVASTDLTQLASLGRRNTSVTLEGLRNASEQKRLAQGTLKGINLLATAFADLGPRESAVLDPALVANQLGVAFKDVVPVLVDSFRLLFGREPRGGALGAEAGRQAEAFLSSKAASTALKLLSKDSSDAAAAFRGFAEARGGVGDFTTKLFESAETAAFTTGNFTALNKITEGLIESFGGVATGLKALGATGRGGGGPGDPTSPEANAFASSVADTAQKLADGADINLKAQKQFLQNVVDTRGDKGALDKLAQSVVGPRATGQDETFGKTPEQLFQLDLINSLREKATGATEDAQKVELEPGGLVAVEPKDGKFVPVQIDSEQIASLIKPLDNFFPKLIDGVLTIGDQIKLAMESAALAITSSVEKAASLIVATLRAIGGIGLRAPGAAVGGIFTKETLRRIGEAGPEAVIPLGRLPQIISQFLRPALDVDQNALRAELPARPSASVSPALGAAATRLDSTASASSGFERQVVSFAGRLDQAMSALFRSMEASRAALSEADARLEDRIRAAENVQAAEINRNRRANGLSAGLRAQSFRPV